MSDSGTINKARRKIRNVFSDVTHDSAAKHVSGAALYVDDIPEPSNLLHCYFGTSDFAHARITNMDLSAVKQYKGVLCVLTASDIPGANEISPVHNHDEPVLADDLVQFAGQALFAVLAESRLIARQAAQLAKVEYEELPAILDIETALDEQSFVLDPHILQQGDAQTAIASSPNRLQGEIRTGGQEHFYLEGQVSMALGHAFLEEIMMEEGRTLNPNWLDYRMPTIHNMAPSEHLDVITEKYEVGQPYRTKEVGEGYVSAILGAIANAIYDAVGVRLFSTPFTAEKILRGLGKIK